MAKAAIWLLIAEILFFALAVVPEHVSTLSSHDHCEICALIHNPPILQAGDIATLGLVPEKEFLSALAALPALLEPHLGAGTSRAPPFTV